VLDIAPTGQGIDIPVVVVAGESTEDNVVAGTFNIDNVLFSASNFLDLKVAITQKLAADGAGMFALTFDFDGINDTGVLASSIAAGAHSLMDAQVGTFRQRMGVFSQLGNGDKGAWVRVFSDKGTVDPSVALYNLPANRDFTFDQTNTGIEAGVNALVTDGVFVGLSLGTAQGKQTLASRGFGSDEIDGDTVGAYLTWLSPDGFYADFSYRWMHFDADLKTLGGVRNIGGDADALNIEAGWNLWTSAGGLMVVPQVQYTRSEVHNIDRIQGDLVDFVSDGGTSSRGRVGIEFQQTFKGDTATWTPYGAISAIREFDGETSFAIGDSFGGTTSTEGTSAMVEFGANATIGRWNVFGGVNWTDGGALDSFVGGQLGVRYTW